MYIANQLRLVLIGGAVLELDSLSSSVTQPVGDGQHGANEPVSAAPQSRAVPHHHPAGRYGEGRRFPLPAILLAIGIHVALAPALFSLGYQAVKTREASLTAVNLAPPPPPRPAAPAQTESETLPTTVEPVTTSVPSPLPRPVIMTIPSAVPQLPPMAVAAPQAAAPAPAPAPPAPPSTVTSDALGTRMISGSPPRYPVECRRRKEQGVVELLLILGTDGRVETISVGKSSGFARLDDAALGAVRRWRWAPTMRDGAPVKVRGVVEIPFVLTTG